MAAPKYLKRDGTSGQVSEVIATETGPASEVIVSTTAAGTIDPTLLPSSSTGAVVHQATIDFGALPVSEASFTIADATVTPTSKIVGQIAYVAPPGKDLDELEMDAIDLKFGPGSGQFTLYAVGQDGYIADKFIVSYVVG